MRSLTRPGLVLAIAVAVVALPTAASGAFSAPAAPKAIAANTTTYQDSSGENAAAPDITTLTVSNTDAGVVQFRVAIPNRAQFTQDMLLLLFVDTDANPQTGDPTELGADYVIEIFGGEAALFRWDGTNFTRRAGDPPATSLIFAYQGGVTVTISAAELGNTKRFGFSFIAVSGIVFDPTTGDTRLHERGRRHRAGGGRGPLPVRGEDHAADARRAQPEADAEEPDGRDARSRFASSPRAPTRTRSSRTAGSRASGASGTRGSGRRSSACRAARRPARGTSRRRRKGKTFRGSVTVVFEGLRAAQAYSAKVR